MCCKSSMLTKSGADVVRFALRQRSLCFIYYFIFATRAVGVQEALCVMCADAATVCHKDPTFRKPVAGPAPSPPPSPPPPSPPPLSGPGSQDASEVFGNAPASEAPSNAKSLQCALGSYADALTVHLSHTVAVGYTLQYVGALLAQGPL